MGNFANHITRMAIVFGFVCYVCPLRAVAGWQVIGINTNGDPLSISCDFQILYEAAGDFCIIFDASTTQAIPDWGIPDWGYWVMVNPADSDSPSAEIARFDPGGAWGGRVVLTTVPNTIQGTELHHLKVERLTNGVINAYLDYQLFMTAQDDTYTNGVMAIRSWGETPTTNMVFTTGSTNIVPPAGCTISIR